MGTAVIDRSRPAVAWLRGWWRYPPLILTAIYIVTLAVKFNQVVAFTYADADAASAPVIGQLFGAAGSHVTLGDYAWYWTLLLELGTRWIPEHRQLWEILPYLFVLVGAGLTVETVYRAAGAVAATLTATVLLCAAPNALHLEMSLNDHSPTWVCLAILGWWLTTLERGRLAEKRWLCAALIVVIGAFIGPEAASDPLVVIAGVVPFALAVVGLRMLGDPADRRWAVVPAIATVVAIALGWVCTDAAMSALHVVRSTAQVTTFASAGQVNTNLLDLWWQCVVALGNGSFFGQALHLTSAIELVCALLALGSVLLLPRLGWRELNSGLRARRASADAVRRALLLFWTASALLLTLAYVTSAAPVDIFSVRYLLGLVYAVAVVLPVICVRRPLPRLAAYLATSVFALSGVIAMVQGQVFNVATNLPSPNAMAGIDTIAEQHHLHLGYAGYWDAAPMTWASHMRVDVYPVQSCGATMCQYGLHTISNWYTQSARRSFIVTDSEQPLLAGPPSALGRPVATYQVDELTMYVYNYDVASKIGPV
jgi:hypothetical protein